jgi:putative transposase
MQVIGLPSHVIRNGRAASRLLAAKTPNIEAARRRDAAARWRRAMADGLTADQAASAVGVTRATLYRWEKKPEPLSRRPHRPRGRRWTSELARAVEDYRNDNPMWGKRKIAVLLGREGLALSVSTIGRILARLAARGAIEPVPLLRRKPAPHSSAMPGACQKAARPRFPANSCKSTRSSSTSGPTSQSSTSPPPIRSPNGPSAASQMEASATSAKSLLDKLLLEAPFPIRGRQVDGGAEFKSVFEKECQARGLELLVLPPKRPDLNGCVERAQSTWRYEFYATYDLPHRIDKLQTFVDAFADRFNHHRPHDALGGLTPAEYLKSRSFDDPAKSHMS